MKNTFGNNISYTLFGESHGKEIGIVIDGLAPGIEIDEDLIRHQLALRRSISSVSTGRRESDDFRIASGVMNGRTCGTPICILIPNTDTKSGDYDSWHGKARPGHADLTGHIKYHGFEDPRGGGHFSGRLTAPIVAAGAIAIKALADKGILIGTHIARCGNVKDRDFLDYEEDIKALNSMEFAALDADAGEAMKEEILSAAKDGDSIGGILESAAVNVPAGLGEPWFDTMEGLLSHALFSIPGIKAVSFGSGFEMANVRGSVFNDPFRMENGRIVTTSNNNGGINGGITNGMPIIIKCAVKPTPSIFREQKTVDFTENKETTLKLEGRHDPAIIHRARVVADSVIALVLCDVLTGRFGTDYLMK